MSPPRWAVPAAAAAAASAAFLPVLRNGYVEWDDLDNFVRSPFVRLPSGQAAAWAATHFWSGHWQPLTWLSLLADKALFGLDPRAVHAGNALLHAAAAALVALCAREVFRGREASPEALDAASLAAALLWALHPLRVEAVAWASERRETLAAALLLGSLLAFLRGRRGASLALYTLSLLAKASGVTFAALLWAADLARGRRPSARALAPYAALGLAAVCVAFAAEAGNGAAAGLGAYSAPLRLAVAAYNLAFYLGKTAWPSALSPIYPFPEEHALLLWPSLAAGALVAAAAAAVSLAGRRRPAVRAAALWYVAALLPVCGLVRFGPQLAADRFAHLASMGPAALLASALLPLGGRRLRAGIAGCAAACAALAVLTWRQAASWRDTETLWRATIARRPQTWTAYLQLGDALEAQGRRDEALALFLRAAELDPRYAAAHNNLGNALAARGRYDLAIPELREAQRLSPGHKAAHFNLGAALEASGRRDEARAEYARELELDPACEPARRALERLR